MSRFRHVLLPLIAAGLGAASLTAAPPPAATSSGIEQERESDARSIERAQDVVRRLVSGEVEPLMSQLTPQMTAAVDAAKLRAIVPALAIQAGAFKAQRDARSVTRDGYRIVLVSCTFERADVDIRVVFDQGGRLAGLGIVPPKTTESYRPPPYVTPAAFREESATVDAGGWPLPATLTRPVGKGPFPGVVLVHGSGPNDRDESFGPNKPFRDLAEGLASQGIAVLRYDKRTKVHASRLAELRQFTVDEEVIADAVAAVALLRRTADVRADRVFVLGHSLGGMLAPRIAVAEPAIAGLVLLAGAVRSLEQSILDQTRYLAQLDGAISPEEQTQIDAAVALGAAVARLQPSDPPPWSPPFSAPAAYWVDLRNYSPSAAAGRLTQPMLILQGERDYQVTMADLAVWKGALEKRANVELRSYPALNHLFMAGSGPSTPSEYSRPGHVDERVVRDIAGWIVRQ